MAPFRGRDGGHRLCSGKGSKWTWVLGVRDKGGSRAEGGIWPSPPFVSLHCWPLHACKEETAQPRLQVIAPLTCSQLLGKTQISSKRPSWFSLSWWSFKIVRKHSDYHIMSSLFFSWILRQRISRIWKWHKGLPLLLSVYGCTLPVWLMVWLLSIPNSQRVINYLASHPSHPSNLSKVKDSAFLQHKTPRDMSCLQVSSEMHEKQPKIA